MGKIINKWANSLMMGVIFLPMFFATLKITGTSFFGVDLSFIIYILSLAFFLAFFLECRQDKKRTINRIMKKKRINYFVRFLFQTFMKKFF